MAIRSTFSTWNLFRNFLFTLNIFSTLHKRMSMARMATSYNVYVSWYVIGNLFGLSIAQGSIYKHVVQLTFHLI